MDSDHRQQQHQNPNPNQTQISTLKSKTLMFYLVPLSILLLAITFNFSIRTNHLKIPLPKSKSHSKPSISSPSDCILWMAPLLSGGGYCSEAWSYILALNDRNKDSLNSFNFRLCIEQHGDLESWNFWEGLPPEVRSLAVKLHQTECKMNETVVVCHSEPGAWYPPLYETYPCPPNVAGYRNFRAVIGRTMFETDRVNAEHVERCNRMDYVWVPTDFHVDTFLRSGVDSSKIVKVVQSVDVDFFDPLKYDSLDLAAIGKLVLGEPNEGLRSSGKEFVFVSVFKWEYRKGWDVLLKAYLEEFCGTDGVILYMLTNPFHTKGDFKNKIIEFVKRSGLKKPCDSWAPVYVIDTHIAQTELPRMYKAVDSFVLPSRGEGWGRPLVEAMSMALPVIATNWSGPTEYLTEENSYPLTVDEMSEVMEGPFKGHLWAEPSVEKLRVLMRRVMTDVEEAKSRGRQAREDMKKRFSPQIVANIVAEQIKVAFDRRT